MMENNCSESYEKINEPYYFESDHVALKENSDYKNLLLTIALLEAQRQQTAKDLETLYKTQDEAKHDPLDFVKKLQKGENLGFPLPQKIAQLPEISWEKYTNNPNFTHFASSRHKTRNKKGGTESNQCEVGQSLKAKLLHGVSPSASSEKAFNAGEDVIVVRGRARDSSKPASFNKLWTEEEQQRLENLLIEYPPEEVEAKRWQKIADALGNRTAIQVASRIQKYFLRLAKEGLPVPGRMPNLSSHSIKKGGHRHHRYNRQYYSASTMLQSFTPPVWMAEDAGDAEANAGRVLVKEEDVYHDKVVNDSSDDDEYSEEIKDTPEFKELQELRRLRQDVLQNQKTALVKHVGYKCDACGCEPIVGVRWHCIDCPADFSFDFCEACSIVPFQKDMHDSSHRLNPIKTEVLDTDYTSNYTYTKANYNYLDSNYMPAS